MFRFVVVTFEILALIMILRSAFMQRLFSDIQASTLQWMHSISMTIENQQLSKFRNGISENIQNLTDSQIKYLYRITSSKAELNRFNLHYCRAGDKNPFIYGTNLHYVCSEISRKGILKV